MDLGLFYSTDHEPPDAERDEAGRRWWDAVCARYPNGVDVFFSADHDMPGGPLVIPR